MICIPFGSVSPTFRFLVLSSPSFPLRGTALGIYPESLFVYLWESMECSLSLRSSLRPNPYVLSSRRPRTCHTSDFLSVLIVRSFEFPNRRFPRSDSSGLHIFAGVDYPARHGSRLGKTRPPVGEKAGTGIALLDVLLFSVLLYMCKYDEANTHRNLLPRNATRAAR